MKKLKQYFFAAIALVVIVSSCTQNDVDLPNELTESQSIQNVISQLRDYVDDEGNPLNDQNPTGNIIFDFCFDFVYPIDLIYNTGTTVTVESFEDLITVIINSTNELYIVGISYPFEVEVYDPTTNEITIQTINNEEEFIDLLESCSNDPCDCSNEFDPVCVEVEQNGATIQIMFTNACYAMCEGFTPNDFVPCENDCNCPTDYDPVCVESPNGAIIEFHNECYAICEGFTPNDFVPCENDCNCPTDYDPVCVESPAGGIIEFDNECLALCEGYTPNDFVDCPVDECECTGDYDPVCVEIGGVIITYYNACYAECDGFTDFVSCQNDCSGCINQPYDPICVEVNGVIITMYNECFLFCNGFTPNNIADCE